MRATGLAGADRGAGRACGRRQRLADGAHAALPGARARRRPPAWPLRRCSSASTELFERGPRFAPSTASSASAPFSSGVSKISSSTSKMLMPAMRRNSRMSSRPSRRMSRPSCAAPISVGAPAAAEARRHAVVLLREHAREASASARDTSASAARSALGDACRDSSLPPSSTRCSPAWRARRSSGSGARQLQAVRRQLEFAAMPGIEQVAADARRRRP